MSGRAEPDPSGNTTRNGSSAVSPTSSPPPTHSVQQAAVGIRSVTSPLTQGQTRSAGRFELPPLNRAPSSSIDTFSGPTPRLAGVPSILNPSQPEEPSQNRRRKASDLESQSSSVPSLPPIATATQSSRPASTFTGHSPAVHYATPTERAPRRILTPRSPSLHRAASLGQLNQSSGTISAQIHLFPTSPYSRTYTIEPGTSGAPPLPTPPAINRTGYGYTAPTSTEAARRASGGTSRARGLSPSASPSTSYSSYSQLDQTSPAAQYVATSLPAMPTSQSTARDPAMGGPLPTIAASSHFGMERQRPAGIPISSSGGQSVYQMMTLETTSGTVQLPVDVQAASRVADEKRRRNAGASARFRQRRKEKEREASTTISKLEQQVKELGEDADFYRRERDIFQGILSTIPGCERHLQRPPSPRLRRSSILSLPGSSGTSVGGPPPTQEQIQRSPEGRNVRRRTSTFSLPPPPPQHQFPAPPPAFHPSLGPPAYGTPLAPQPAPMPQHGRLEHLPPTIGRGQMTQPQQMSPGNPQPHPQAPMQQHYLSGPPQVLQPTPQTGPWNHPYSSERRPSGPNHPREGR